LLDGVPVLVAAILSPRDAQEQVDAKTDDYLQAGVALVWVIDPYDRTVTIYRPGQEPEVVNVRFMVPLNRRPLTCKAIATSGCGVGDRCPRTGHPESNLIANT
jgi:Uma2 family endonuclease